MIKKPGSVLGTTLEHLELVVMIRMLLNIMDNTTHLLQPTGSQQSVFSSAVIRTVIGGHSCLPQ